MNELQLYPLTCPQCGAPGLVREGTRITDCDRCGAALCLTATATPRYEAMARLNAPQAASRARGWLERRGGKVILGRPELILIPFHEIVGRRVGVFERKVPERKRVHRRIYNPQYQTEDVESKWVYVEREDTKVMVSDVQYLTPAATTRWDLQRFDAADARHAAELRNFDLAEAQRRATVYAEESTPTAIAEERFADRSLVQSGSAELVAGSRRTIFFPFWSIPVQTRSGGYEVVVDGLGGSIVAWRLPETFRASGLTWALLAVPGALGLGHGLRALLFGTSMIEPVLAFAVGIVALAAAFTRSNQPDWTVRTWPQPDTVPRLERHA